MAESFPLAITFPKDSPAWKQHEALHKIAKTAAHSLYIYPTQLMHCAFAIVLALIVWRFGRSRLKRSHGEEILLLGMLYPWARFVVEFYRADNEPSYLFGSLTISQSVGIFVFIICLAAFMLRRYKGWGRLEQEPPSGIEAAKKAK